MDCTCRMAYLREVELDDLFTCGPAEPEYRATGDAIVDGARVRVPVRGEGRDGLGFARGTTYSFAVIATTCPHRCFGGYVPEA